MVAFVRRGSYIIGAHMATTRVYFEEGKHSVFAAAIDWPGWCRRAKTPDLALAALDDYRDRYGVVLINRFAPGRREVVGTVPGDATTDFGAPSRAGPWDDVPWTAQRRRRQVGILTRCWDYFDAVVDNAPSELRRGPRGGGRDRDDVARHVQEAERVYGAKVAVKVPPRTPWGEQRESLASTLATPQVVGAWPASYAVRRMAWHVLDHAWEIEDKTT
jgi:hypothetical protein